MMLFNVFILQEVHNKWLVCSCLNIKLECVKIRFLRSAKRQALPLDVCHFSLFLRLKFFKCSFRAVQVDTQHPDLSVYFKSNSLEKRIKKSKDQEERKNQIIIGTENFRIQCSWDCGVEGKPLWKPYTHSSAYTSQLTPVRNCLLLTRRSIRLWKSAWISAFAAFGWDAVNYDYTVLTCGGFDFRR